MILKILNAVVQAAGEIICKGKIVRFSIFFDFFFLYFPFSLVTADSH